jgi:hypothetical protein
MADLNAQIAELQKLLQVSNRLCECLPVNRFKKLQQQAFQAELEEKTRIVEEAKLFVEAANLRARQAELELRKNNASLVYLPICLKDSINSVLVGIRLTGRLTSL